MFSGAPDRASVLVVLRFLRELALLSRLLGLRLLTPLLSQVGARRKASRLCFFFFFFDLAVSWRGAWDFCNASDLDFSLIYQDSSINVIALFLFCRFELLGS